MITGQINNNRTWWSFAFSALYFAAAAAALVLTKGIEGIAAIWPASGILLAGLLLLGKSQRLNLYIGAFVASMAANTMIGTDPLIAAGFSIANLIEAWLALALIARFSKPSRRTADPYNLAIGGAASLAAALVSGAAATILSGAMTSQFFVSWTSTVFFGMVTIAPPILFIAKDWPTLRQWDKLTVFAHALLIGTLSSVSFWQDHLPLMWLPMAAIGYSTFRLGLTGAALGLLTVAAIGSFHSAAGFGIMNASQTPFSSTLLLQLYLTGLLVSILPLAALLERHDADVEALEEAKKSAEEQAQISRTLAETDALTGIANRGKVMADLRQEVAKAITHGTPLSVMMVDIDHFKSINDSFGHASGDHALKTIAALGDQLADNDGYFGRVGGEEFLMVLPNLDGASALEVADRFQTIMREYDWESLSLPVVTLSIGIAAHRPGQDDSKLLGNADAALYLAKNDGRNRNRLAA
ncbi:MAG: diguanylate cyclase [Pseudomonadota bacterium]